MQLRVLEELEGAERYNRWLAELILPYLGDDPIEAGSGRGTNASILLGLGASRLTVSEVDPAALAELEQRFGRDPRVVVETVDLDDAPSASHSAIVALNVLEHIEDDRRALRNAASLVRPGGRVVVLVPAFPFAAGNFDHALGHHRRYTKSTLRSAYEDAELSPEMIRYVNAPGLVAWFLWVRVLRAQPREGVLLQLWDRGVIPLAQQIESRWAPPFGQSVLAVGRVKG